MTLSSIRVYNLVKDLRKVRTSVAADTWKTLSVKHVIVLPGERT